MYKLKYLEASYAHYCNYSVSRELPHQLNFFRNIVYFVNRFIIAPRHKRRIREITPRSLVLLAPAVVGVSSVIVTPAWVKGA